MSGSQFLRIINSNLTIISNCTASNVILENNLFQFNRIATLEISDFSLSDFSATHNTFNDVYIIISQASAK